jgi:ATP-dependent helicase HepA
LTLVARDRAAAYFADEEKGAQVLVCSEIGSEGRNFQFAAHLVLFDLPLNPDLLEQRIGRLDRIGQRNTVQIHVPFYQGSAQSVLLSWYHEGLDAIEHTCPAGQVLFEFFEQDLLQSLQLAEDSKPLEQLLQRTREKTAEVLLELQQGRDRLLELNSFNHQRADEIVGDMIRDERRKELSDYMERVFDLFGVEQEHHSTNSLVIRPGAHMPVHSFPALPDEGITATYQRDLALSREDMHYLTWEHPMVSGAMDMVLSGEFGNTAFCTLKLPPLKPGTILLEALFVVSCIAPEKLQLHRFLTMTTLRLVVDNRNNDLTQILSSAHLNRLAQEASLHNARDLVRHTRPRITAMLDHARILAEAQKGGILETAMTSMRARQQVEWERLQALAAINPNIRQVELMNAKGAAERLEPYLGGAQLRLDALRVAMVTE